MKKKVLAVGMIVVLALGMVACGGNQKGGRDSAQDVQQSQDVQEEAKDNVVKEQENLPESTPEAAKSEGTLTFTAPEGFVYDEATMMWGTASEQVTNINYTSVANDGSFSSVTKEVMKPALEQSLASAYGEKVEIEITVWEYITVDGYEALDYEIRYDYYDLKVVQRQIIVNATDKFHYVTMTYLDDSAYIEAFDEVVASIKFEN